MNNRTTSARVGLYRLLWFWGRDNALSIKAVTWGLYQYRFGWCKEHRKRMKRTKATWLWCYPLSAGVNWWFAPRFEARVMDGMGEHYGYPRHYCRVMIWWNHVGYVWGVHFDAPNAASLQRRDSDVGTNA